MRTRLKNFRHELRDTPGLSVVSASVADAGFLELPDGVDGHWAAECDLSGAVYAVPGESRADRDDASARSGRFVGDGETDEVDTLGAISLGAREKLDNLIFVVNCNLQRLDGPVRGNKRIIDELEGVFRGAGWNVIKVIWGSDWDELFERDHTGLLLRRMEECVDGDFQTFKAKDGALSARALLRQVSGAAGAGEGQDRRAADAAASRRTRSGEDLQRLQAGDGAQGRADGDPGEDGEGLRAWARRRRAMRRTRRRS